MSKLFKRYDSITNSYSEKFIEGIRERGFSTGTWVSTEKIHGSSFCFITDGEDVWRGKRSGICDDQFFNNWKLDSYEESVLMTFENLKDAERIEEGATMVLYGEIFGGQFFGQQEPGSSRIQSGVNYHPGTEFAAFDIKIIDEDGHSYFLDYLTFMQYIDLEIPTCPELARGSFDDLLKMENDFPSKVPAMFGLQVPKGEHAQCEGFVMKPLDRAPSISKGRCILKSKCAAHSERSGRERRPKADYSLTEEQKYTYAEFTTYINQSRLEAVLSKEGVVEWKDFGRIQGLLLQDAKKDFELDTTICLKDDDFWAKAHKSLGNIAGEVTREHLKRIL